MTLNHDGRPDLVFQHAAGTLAVWFMDGARKLDHAYFVPQNPNPAGKQVWRLASVNALDRDGNLDLLFQHKDGSLAVWYMNGVKMVKGEILPGLSPGPGATLVGSGDYDGDRSVDLLFQDDDGKISIWFLRGTAEVGRFSYNSTRPGESIWKVIAAGDFDGDEVCDLAMQNSNGTVGF